MNQNYLKDLISLLKFENLHLSINLKGMINTLKEVAGVYAIINTVTGQVYIGSSINKIRDAGRPKVVRCCDGLITAMQLLLAIERSYDHPSAIYIRVDCSDGIYYII